MTDESGQTVSLEQSDLKRLRGWAWKIAGLVLAGLIASGLGSIGTLAWKASVMEANHEQSQKAIIDKMDSQFRQLSEGQEAAAKLSETQFRDVQRRLTRIEGREDRAK